MRMRPATGRTNPATARNAVVLPEPDGSMIAMISPGSVFEVGAKGAEVVAEVDGIAAGNAAPIFGTALRIGGADAQGAEATAGRHRNRDQIHPLQAHHPASRLAGDAPAAATHHPARLLTGPTAACYGVRRQGIVVPVTASPSAAAVRSHYQFYLLHPCKSNRHSIPAMGLIPSPTVLSTDEMGRVAPPIFTSVGKDGVNAPGDVFVVQSLLNDRLPKPHAPVTVTGVVDVGTLLAIENYQAAVMGTYPPSGRVDPGSTTYYSLAAHPLIDEKAEAHVGHYGELPPLVIEAAEASQKHWQVPASVTLAQWALESAWGAAMPPGSNNPFGIKAVGNQPAVTSPTYEVVNGETITVTVNFRVFSSVGEAFDEHGRLIATNPIYGPAMQAKQDPDAFAEALVGVYATDPDYGTKLKWLIRNYNLRNYGR
jgi:hypothetical protein